MMFLAGDKCATEDMWPVIVTGIMRVCVFCYDTAQNNPEIKNAAEIHWADDKGKRHNALG